MHKRFLIIHDTLFLDLELTWILKAYEIIKYKGATYFGIGACVADICKTIIFDEKTILPLSFFHKEYGICFSLPTVLDANGIEKVFDLPLDTTEKESLLSSIEKIKKDANF